MILVRIRFHDSEKSTSSRIWIFGEDLWKRLRDEKRVRIDIGEIDRSVDEISFRVRRKFLKRAVQVAQLVMREHMVDDEAAVLVEDPVDTRA
jgi:hypothetical protein